jgi:hypothetical protein
MKGLSSRNHESLSSNEFEFPVEVKLISNSNTVLKEEDQP